MKHVNNMEEAIEAIETSTKLFENAGTEIKLLVKTVEEFQKIKDVSKVCHTISHSIAGNIKLV